MQALPGKPILAGPGRITMWVVTMGLLCPVPGRALEQIPPGFMPRAQVEVEALPALVEAVEHVLLGRTELARSRDGALARSVRAQARGALDGLDGAVVVSVFEGWGTRFPSYYPDLDDADLRDVTDALVTHLRANGQEVEAGLVRIRTGPVPSGLRPEVSRELGRTIHGGNPERVLAECERTWTGLRSYGRQCTLAEGVKLLLEVSFPFPSRADEFDIPARLTYPAEDGSLRRFPFHFRMIQRSGEWVVADILQVLVFEQE